MLLGSDAQELDELAEDSYEYNVNKCLPQVCQVWMSFCTYIQQELTLGRSVNVPNLGVFIPAAPQQPRQFGFRAAEKIVRDKDIHWEGPMPSVGPIAKAKYERIAELSGLSKGKAEEILQVIFREMFSKIAICAEATFEFNGLGTLKAMAKTATWEPVPVQEPSLRHSQAPSPGHVMFGANGKALLSKVASGPLASPKTLPKIDLQRRSMAGWDQAAAKPTVGGLTKSTSTPTLKAEPGVKFEDITFPPRPQFPVPIPPSLTMKRSPSGPGFLSGYLKQDADALNKSLTRQLPADRKSVV